jgi:hypothetical protein
MNIWRGSIEMSSLTADIQNERRFFGLWWGDMEAITISRSRGCLGRHVSLEVGYLSRLFHSCPEIRPTSQRTEGDIHEYGFMDCP